MSETLEREVIDITPHHGAMTKAGKANFVRFSDATSEFVDNSLQAYRQLGGDDSASRDVGLRLFMSNKKAPNNQQNCYLVILDKGCGMDEKALKDFATYSLDKATRRQKDDGFISKFGVGAKQSGFFLGQRIRVITSPIGSDSVLELTLDEAVFEDRYKNNEKVFETHVYKREAGNCMALVSEDERSNELMMQHVVEHEMANKAHFTTVVLKLRESTVRDLYSRERYKEIPYELAQIYHFYLNPSNRPDEILETLDFLKKSQRVKGASFLYKAAECLTKRKSSSAGALATSSTSSSSSSSSVSQRAVAKGADMVPLNLNFQMFEGTSVGTSPLINLDLEKLEDDIKEYKQHAKAVFRCDLIFPDPTTEQPAVGSGATGLGDRAKATMQCLFFYYPYVGKETRPRPKKRKDNTASRHVGADKVWNTDRTDSDESEEEMDVDDDDLDANAIDIFWVNRLVPETKLSSLPFLPNLKSRGDCDASKVSEKWRDRIKGFVFLDHSWDSISNNKLKIQVDPDLETYLNDRIRKEDILYYPNKTSTTLFKQWLADCHRILDKESHFYGRLHDEEKLCRTAKQNFNASLFKNLDFGADIKLKVGDRVKLRLGKEGRLTKAKYINAEIVAFEADLGPGAKGDADECYGRGFIRYLRLPLEVYHPAVEEDSLAQRAKRLIANEPVSLIHLDHNDFHVQEKDIKSLLKKAPHRVELFLFETANSPGICLNNNNNSVHVVEAGKNYYKIGARIISENRRYCAVRPDSMDKNSRGRGVYKVHLRMMSRDGQEELFDYGVASDWWIYDPQSKGDIKSFEASGLTADRLSQVEVNDKASHLISYYGPNRRAQAGEFLPTLRFEHVGEYCFCVEVHDGSDIISRATTSMDIVVKAQPISKFELEWDRGKNGFDPLAMDYHIGHVLPGFTLLFLDAAGNLVRERRRHIMVHVTSSECFCEVKYPTGEFVKNSDGELVEEYNLMEKPMYEFNWDDNGKIYFDDRTFFTRPKERGMIPDDTGYKNVTWTISVYLAGEGADLENLTSQLDKEATTTLLGSQKFTIRYIPSIPVGLRLLDPTEQPIAVENEAMLPSLKFVAEDAWGNRCNANSSKEIWKVKLGENEYVSGVSEGDTEKVIDTNGWVSFSHLSSNYDGALPADGEREKLEFFITRTKRDGSKLDPAKVKRLAALQHPSANRNGLIRAENNLGAAVSILLTPRDFPDWIEVLYKGESVPNPWRVSMGSTIDNLSFRVLGKDGHPLQEFKPGWIKDKPGVSKKDKKAAVSEKKKAGLLCSWSEKTTAIKFDTAVSEPPLPDIQLDQGCVDTFEFDVAIRLFNGVVVGPYSFKIEAEPGKAARWKIVNSDIREGIMSGESADLATKIPAMVLVDEEDNLVPWRDDVHPIPMLTVHYVEPSNSAGDGGDDNAGVAGKRVCDTNGNGVKKSRTLGDDGGAVDNKRKHADSEDFPENVRQDSFEGVVPRVYDGGSDEEDEEENRFTPTTPRKGHLTRNSPLRLLLERGMYLPKARKTGSSGSTFSARSISQLTQGAGARPAEEAAREALIGTGIACFVLKANECIHFPANLSSILSNNNNTHAGSFSGSGSSGHGADSTTLPRTVWLQLCDDILCDEGLSSGKKRKQAASLSSIPPIEPDILPVSLTSGVMHSVCVTCESLGINTATRYANIEVNRLTNASFTVTLVDKAGYQARFPKHMRKNSAKFSFSTERGIINTSIKKAFKTNESKFQVKLPNLESILDKLEEEPATKKSGSKKAKKENSFKIYANFECLVDGKSGETRELNAAEITCMKQSLNAVGKVVTAMFVGTPPERREAIHGAKLGPLIEAHAHKDDNSALEVSCVDALPTVIIMPLLDEGSVHLPDDHEIEDCFEVSLEVKKAVYSTPGAKRNKKIMYSSLLFDDYYSPLERLHGNESNLEGFILKPRTDTDATKGQAFVGQHRLSIKYIETRPSLKNLPENKKKVVDFCGFTVLPGECTVLRCHDDTLFFAAVASNFSDAAADERCVVSQPVHICSMDDRSNNTICPEGARVFCFMHHLSESADRLAAIGSSLLEGGGSSTRSSTSTARQRGDLPRFVGADECELLWGTISDDRFTATFARLELMPDVGTQSGDIYVTFCMDTRDCEAGLRDHAALPTCTVKFRFETDAERLEQANHRQKLTKALKDSIQAYEMEKSQLEGEAEELRRRLRALVQKKFMPSFNLKKFAPSDSGTQTQASQTSRLHLEELEKEKRRLSRQISDMSKSKSRPAVREAPHLPRLRDHSFFAGNDKVVGYVIDLGYVEDKTEALILSNMAKRHCGSLVVKDSATAREMYDKGIAAWSLEHMLPFRVPCNGRNPAKKFRKRNEAEMARASLPLDVLRNVPGRPEYLVNLVSLDKENEHLRDTLFWSIFKKSLLFDDLPSGSAYRDGEIRKGRSAPAIFTRKGEMIRSDGLMDPSNKVNLNASDQRRGGFVFGAQPASATEDFIHAEEDVKAIDEALPLLKELGELTQRLDNLIERDAEISSKQGQLDCLEQE